MECQHTWAGQRDVLFFISASAAYSSKSCGNTAESRGSGIRIEQQRRWIRCDIISSMDSNLEHEAIADIINFPRNFSALDCEDHHLLGSETSALQVPSPDADPGGILQER